jgi:fructan beta-fructosidase
MLVSINPGGPNGGSATQYFTGKFDGHKFVSDGNNVKWVDWGRDNYAGVTWSGIPGTDGRRLFLGWMSNWNYATVVPTKLWRSAMTIPRELSLTDMNGKSSLISRPVIEIEKLRRKFFNVIAEPVKITGEKVINSDSINLMQSELIFNFNVENIKYDSLGFILDNSLNEKLIIGYSAVKKLLFVNRRNAGNSGFSKEFASDVSAPYIAGKKIRMHLFIDAASMELFVDSGKLVMTNIIFPTENYNRLRVFSTGGEILSESGGIYNLERIWK